MTIKTAMPEYAPADERADEGYPPDPEVRFGYLAAEALRDRWARATLEPSQDEGPKKRPYVRPSDAGKCSRRLAYVAGGVERSNPMDLAGGISTSLGTFLGAVLAHAMADRPHLLAERLGREVSSVLAEYRFEPESTVVETPDGPVAISCFVDIIVCWADGTETVIEVKSTGDYSFKAKCGLGRSRVAEGPDIGHVRQLAEYLKLRPNATEGVVCYLATNPVSKAIAAKAGVGDERRVAAEWTYSREQLVDIADKELRRHRRVLEMVADGDDVPRRIPGMPGGLIVNPATGAWLSDDGQRVESFWGCAYCGWQNTCIADLHKEQEGGGEHGTAENE